MKRLGKSRRGTVILNLLAAEPGTRARVMFGTDG